MKNYFGLFVAFVGVAIIGGALGIMFAPESGDITHKKIEEALEKRGIKLNKNDMNDLINELKLQLIADEK